MLVLTQLVQSLRTAATPHHSALLPLLDALSHHANHLANHHANHPDELPALRGELKSARRRLRQLTAINAQQKQQIQDLQRQLQSEAVKRVNTYQLQQEAQRQLAQLQRQQSKADIKRSRDVEVQCDLLSLHQLQDLQRINLNCQQENEALLLVLQEWSREDINSLKDSEDNDHSTVASSETAIESESEEEEDDEEQQEEENIQNVAASSAAHRLLSYFWTKSRQLVQALATSQ